MLTTKQIRALDPRCKPYKLQLTPAEVAALEWLGARYAWSDTLRNYLNEDGLITMAEHEAWEWCAFVGCDGDAEVFPGAADNFALKLTEFYQNII